MTGATRSVTRSWIARLFPYVRFLEDRVNTLQAELSELREEGKSERREIEKSREVMLDRLVRLTTGFSLSEPMENAIELQAKQEEVLKTRFNLPDLMRSAEAMSLDLAAEMNDGTDDTPEDTHEGKTGARPSPEAPPSGLFVGGANPFTEPVYKSNGKEKEVFRDPVVKLVELP